jgi:EMAP domain
VENIDNLIEQMDSEEAERMSKDERLTHSAENDIIPNQSDGIKYDDVGSEADREYLDFDTFEKVDLRIARIISIEDHKGSRKHMYHIKLDVGELGHRSIVAGIGDYYTKEELVGKEIVIVANLKPRNIAGIESNGMLLAAESGNQIAVLTPDKEIKEGSRAH